MECGQDFFIDVFYISEIWDCIEKKNEKKRYHRLLKDIAILLVLAYPLFPG